MRKLHQASVLVAGSNDPLNTLYKRINTVLLVCGVACFGAGCDNGLNTSQQTTEQQSITTPQQSNSELTAMKTSPSVSQADFGSLPDGTKISQFTLKNSNGIEAKIITWGGIITSLKTKDKNGEFGDIVLGFNKLEPYLAGTPYFGALIGRYGNRIAKGQFILDGKTYKLATNNEPNHLHGGIEGFDKKVWTAEPFSDATAAGLKLNLVSPDNDQGYPGTLNVTVTYTLNNDDELVTDYYAVTDKPTIVNLTQHSYFNLVGEGDILGHLLMIDADKFTPVDSTLIPTGQLKDVAGTPFDFRTPTAIGSRINQDNEQLGYGGGYDHNYVLSKQEANGFELAARVTEPASGRILEVWTEEPGIQFYSGNFLDGSLKGKNRDYTHRSGFCLEPQHYPDSPNKPDFPSTTLLPGEEYSTRMSFKFLVE